MVPILASHRRRLLQFLVVPLLPHLHKFLFQFPEQNIDWNIAPLRSARIVLSNESLFTQNWFRTRELCPFYPSTAIYSDEFQNAQRRMFLSYLLLRVFKFIDLGCVGTGIWWSFRISTFSSLYILSMCKIWWKQRGLLSNFGDVDEFDFFFDHEFIGMLCHACKTIQVHNLPPRWQFGVEIIANKSKISPKILNLWHR